MTETPSEQEARWIAQFEEMGESQVRAQLLAAYFAGSIRPAAIRWLSEKERQREARDLAQRERSDASTSEQIELARHANQIAKVARNAAIAALIVAAIGTIATIIGWFIH